MKFPRMPAWSWLQKDVEPIAAEVAAIIWPEEGTTEEGNLLFDDGTTSLLWDDSITYLDWD